MHLLPPPLVHYRSLGSDGHGHFAKSFPLWEYTTPNNQFLCLLSTSNPNGSRRPATRPFQRTMSILFSHAEALIGSKQLFYLLKPTSSLCIACGPSNVNVWPTFLNCSLHFFVPKSTKCFNPCLLPQDYTFHVSYSLPVVYSYTSGRLMHV